MKFWPTEVIISPEVIMIHFFYFFKSVDGNSAGKIVMINSENQNTKGRGMWLTNTKGTKITQPSEGFIKQLIAVSQREQKGDCVRKHALFSYYLQRNLSRTRKTVVKVTVSFPNPKTSQSERYYKLRFSQVTYYW